MKVDQSLVRTLREAKAWSQDHLAQVSGLSLRTIQRVEAEGTASPETKMAIASALGVAAETLMPKPTAKRSRFAGATVGTACGIAGVATGAAAACFGIATGSSTAIEAGTAYGLVGLLSGLSCAFIATVQNRYWREERADA